MKTLSFQRPEGILVYDDHGGDGQTVLMLPGVAALRSEYRFLAPALVEAGYRAVAADLRGQGDSSVPWERYDVPAVGGDVLALIEHLGKGPAHVIGTSFAAAPAVWAAVERPEMFRSLTLIGASVRDGEVGPLMKVMIWFMLNNPWRARTWVMYYRTIYPTRKPADFEDYLKQLEQNLKQPGRFAAAAAMASTPRRPCSERLSQVQTPTLVIMGDKDPDFPDPVAEARYIAEQTRGRLELIEGAGHYPQSDTPEKTAALVIDFLKQTGA
jgi:pimeloyl-ACP methyl ester carboxylesterase